MTMNDCPDGEMRDILPEYASGVLPNEMQERVEAHVAHCTDCAAELALIRTVSASYRMPKVDVARIVAALPQPVRQARASARLFRAQQWRMAAGIAMIAIGGISVAVLRSTMHSASPAVPAPSPTPTLIAVQTPAGVMSPVVQPSTPTELAKHTPRTNPVKMGELSFGGGLSDLSDAQLKSLLLEIDSLDGAPSTEPEVHATPIVPAIVPSQQGGNHG